MSQVKDPVCGMMVDPEDAAGSTTFEGHGFTSVPTSAGGSSRRIRRTTMTGSSGRSRPIP
jgi:hypothetical protein